MFPIPLIKIEVVRTTLIRSLGSNSMTHLRPPFLGHAYLHVVSPVCLIISRRTIKGVNYVIWEWRTASKRKTNLGLSLKKKNLLIIQQNRFCSLIYRIVMDWSFSLLFNTRLILVLIPISVQRCKVRQ